MKIYIPQRTTAQQRPASSSKGHPLKQIIDNRPGAIQQKEMLDGINSVGKVIQCSKFTLSDPQDPELVVEIDTAEKEKTSDWLNKQFNSDNYKFINLFIKKIKNSIEDTDKALLAEARERLKSVFDQIRNSQFDLRPRVGQGTMTVGDAEQFPDGMITTGASPCVAMAIRSEEWGVFGVAHFDSDVNHDDGIDKQLFKYLKGNDKTAVSIRESVIGKCWGKGVYGDVSAIYNSLESFKTMIVNKLGNEKKPFNGSFNGFQIILTRGMDWTSNDLYGFYSNAIQQVFPGSELLLSETKGGAAAGKGTVEAIDDNVTNIDSCLMIHKYEERTTPLTKKEREQLHKVLTNVLLILNHTESQKQNNAVDNKFIWDSLKRFSDIPKISGGELSGEINGLIDKIDAKVDSFKKQLTSDGKRPILKGKGRLNSILLPFTREVYRILSSMLNVENPELILKNANIIEAVLDIIIGTTQEMQKFESSEKTDEECQVKCSIICDEASKKIRELNSMFKAKLVPVEKKESSGPVENFGDILERVVNSVDKAIFEKYTSKITRNNKIKELSEKKALWSKELGKLKGISDAEARQSKERDLSANVKTELEKMMDFAGIDKATIGQILEPLSGQQAEKIPELITEVLPKESKMESGKEQSKPGVSEEDINSLNEEIRRLKEDLLRQKEDLLRQKEDIVRLNEDVLILRERCDDLRKDFDAFSKSKKKGK